MKWDVIYKFFLTWGLALSLSIAVISGVMILQGTENALFIHRIFTALFILGLLLHWLDRKKKWLKINTQFADLIQQNQLPAYCSLERLILTFSPFSPIELAEQLQLTPADLLQKWRQGNIRVTDPHKSLRENFPLNDEKIFSAISIALQMRFDTQLHLKGTLR